MDKLSELSKPVAWAFKDANDVDHASITKKANLYGRHDFQPLYSQEYVSALLAELEAKEQLISEMEINFKTQLSVSLAELQQRLATPVRLPDIRSDDYHETGWFQHMKYYRDVERSLRAAGFTVGDE